ncbi:aminotransferase class III-fold pyridoxal phosphate-dependent enzyme [Streptomyces sp. NPDC005930]|uniref:aminotransferase class III-fold pyridoxal phosphate-dependent enzyme n=1 Tax=Streptomyces sp. NPDC005930 TaxID=3364736 RepID=UPI0036ACFCBB
MAHRVQFPGPGGTNAVEAALKLARKVTGRHKVLYFQRGFHGMTLGALAVTADPMKRAGAGVPLPDTAPPYDAPAVDEERAVARLTHQLAAATRSGPAAAVVVETVQGEGGVNPARPGWLRALARLTREHGALPVVDDIQMGCGRTGPSFSFEEAAIVPDIVCLSKSIGGYGTPMALTLSRPEYDIWKPGEHNGTFRGYNPAFVTAPAPLSSTGRTRPWKPGRPRWASGFAARSPRPPGGTGCPPRAVAAWYGGCPSTVRARHRPCARRLTGAACWWRRPAP